MKLLKPIILYSSLFICAALAATSCSEENVDNSIKVTSMHFPGRQKFLFLNRFPHPMQVLMFGRLLIFQLS